MGEWSRRSFLRVGAGACLGAACGSVEPADDHARDVDAGRGPLGPGWQPIAGPEEPGPRLEVEGYVVDSTGRPVPDVEIHIFHADRKGRYHPSGDPEAPPRLQVDLQTDTRGWFGVETIVPGAYNGGPAHFHLFVTPPGGLRLIAGLNFDGSRAVLYGPADAIPASATAVFPITTESDRMHVEVQLVLPS